jgi:hypothetical protein
MWYVDQYEPWGAPRGRRGIFRDAGRLLKLVKPLLLRLAHRLSKVATQSAENPPLQQRLFEIAMGMQVALDHGRPFSAYRLFKWTEEEVGSPAGGIEIIGDIQPFLRIEEKAQEERWGPWEGEAETVTEAGEWVEPEPEEGGGLEGIRLGAAGSPESWVVTHYNSLNKPVSKATFHNYEHFVKAIKAKLLHHADVLEKGLGAYDQNPEYFSALAHLAEGIREDAQQNTPFRAFARFD